MEFKNLYRDFGADLKKHREIKGFTQISLARSLGLNRASLSKIEAGKQNIQFHEAIMLASAVGIDLTAYINRYQHMRLKKQLEKQPAPLRKELRDIIWNASLNAKTKK